MDKNKALKLLNPLLLVLFACQAGTGIFHSYLPHELFEEVHSACGMVFSAAAVLHLALNWVWVKSVYSRN